MRSRKHQDILLCDRSWSSSLSYLSDACRTSLKFSDLPQLILLYLISEGVFILLGFLFSLPRSLFTLKVSTFASMHFLFILTFFDLSN